MAQQTDRKYGLSRVVPSGSSSAACVVTVVLLVAVAPSVAGLAGAAVAGPGDTGATAQSAGPAVDVVIVFDRSESTNEDRYHLAQEVDRLASRFDEAGIDARYGLVTYDETNQVEQPLTADFASFEEAMHFPEGGSVENASDAILTATDMDFRDDAETVVVLVTDEDDDSSNATREEALSSLDGFHFVSVSPSSPSESSCAVHTPPCDDRSENELRTMVEQVDGDWIDQGQSAGDIVDGIADAVESTVDTGTEERSTGSSGGSSSSTAEYRTTGTATNRTTAEVGDPVRFNKTVENVGTADGTYEAFLSHGGTIVAQRTVSIPEDESRNITFVHRFDEPGEHDVLINHELVARVTVTEPHNESIDVAIRPDGMGLTATVADAWRNGTVRIPVTDGGLVPDALASIEAVVVSVDDPNVTPVHDLAFDLEVLANETPPNGTDPLPEHVTPARYLTLESSLGSGLTGVQFEYLPGAEDTTLYRYDHENATWVPLGRMAMNGSEGLWRTNTTTGSLYAVGVPQPAMRVTEVALDDPTVTVGETATVTVTVRNDGATGTFNATLRMDGSVVDVEEVEVPADGTRTVSMTVTPDRPGRYTLAVPSGPSTTMQVDAAPTATTQPATESPGADQTLTALPGFGIAVAVLALVAAALFAMRRD